VKTDNSDDTSISCGIDIIWLQNISNIVVAAPGKSALVLFCDMNLYIDVANQIY